MMNLKHIPLQGAYNVRDLGGYPTTDGRITRWGVLYRSDALSELTKEDWNILKERNVKTVIDLRSSSETKSRPVLLPDGIAYYHFSLMKDLDELFDGSGQENILQSMKLDYAETLFENLSCAVDILNTILSRMDAGAIDFFCSAGKDRTGIVASLVLYLCHTIREDIVADYMVSSTYNTNGINKKIENLPEEFKKGLPDPEFLKNSVASDPKTISSLLDEMEKRDLCHLLEENGFSMEDQQKLVLKFTEEIR